MHLALPPQVGRLLGAFANSRPVAMAAPRPRPSTPSPGGWPPPNPLPAEASLRIAREEALLDRQARVQLFVELPEAAGLARLAVELAGAEVTLEQARTVLSAARPRPGKGFTVPP